jgi:two-component system, sensor histidine kinase YesM
MRQLWTTLRERIRRMRIVPKLFIGYMALICIPFAVFGFIFYKQMYDNLLEQYRVSKTQMMERAYRNLEVELTKLEALYPLFQNNTNLTEYLGGDYAIDWDMVYNYKKEIGPTFSFAYIGNQFLDKITVYKTHAEISIVSPEIENMDHFTAPVDDSVLKALTPNRGVWLHEAYGDPGQLPAIRFLHRMYNDSYTRELGLLQLKLNDALIKQFFQTLQSSEQVWRTVIDDKRELIHEDSSSMPAPRAFTDNEAYYTAMLDRIPESGVTSFYTKNNKYLISVASVNRWNLAIMEVHEVHNVLNVRKEIGWSIAAGLLLLILLSVLYYTVAASITKRIIRFSRHMKRVDDPKLAYYPGESGADEIGFLISTYNAMMLRVDELSHVITQTELLKKEAEIKMLQAQINPHFLYNTLETMRMLAIMKGEDEIAEVGLKLGKLLRYSLSKAKDETKLAEELENVQHYIDIHRLRMGERLHVELQVDERALSLTCPRFILQPLVENSIMHGIEKMRGKGIISLQLEEEPDAVTLRLSDNGAGIPEERLRIIHEVLAGKLTQEQIPFSGGIGLLNVNERIKAYFGGGSGMTIQSVAGQGTMTVIRMEKERRSRIA